MSEPAVGIEHKHWVEQLGASVIGRSGGPYIISGGMTTSGPVHMGTLCEMLYPQAVLRYLKQQDKRGEYIFVADILDAFDSVPATHAKYEAQLAPHLGKPLCHVPDPEKCHPSLGDHFLSQGFELGKQFGVQPTLLRAQDLYASGKMDKYAKLFMENQTLAREVVASSSNNPNLSPDWSPIMPICEKCARIATTRTTAYEASTQTYSYSCDKDVKYTKGCGHLGKDTFSSHHYKIVWRLDWPSRMDALHTSIEGAGVDHHTKGGSWDTCQAVFKQIFKKEPPIGYQFGFVLFQGKKYSKSKGNGMGIGELMALLPAPVLAFILLRPDLTENRDINPTPDNLLRIMGEFESAGRLALKLGLVDASGKMLSATVPPVIVVQTESPAAEISRADRKRALAFAIANNRPLWQVDFNDLLIYYGLYGNWDLVAQKLGHEEDVKFLAPFVQAWSAQNLLPEDYHFQFIAKKSSDPLVIEWARRLDTKMSALDIHNSVFTLAREQSLKPAELFSKLYAALIGKPKGPKLGRMVEVIGVARVKDALLS